MDLNTTDAAPRADSEERAFYGKNHGRVPTLAPLHPGMTYPEILEADNGLVPAAAIAPGTHVPQSRRVPYHYYWDPETAKLEDERIWNKLWLVACREEDIRNVGDRAMFDIRDRSYLIVRVHENKIKAYYNSCRHRGRALCTTRLASGNEIRCQFHGWTYNLDGTIKWIPEEHEFPVAETKGLSLVEVKVDTWGGNVFINADPSSPPLQKALGVIPEMFGDFSLAGRNTVIHVRKKARCNWKIAQELFQESYHSMEAHWDLISATDATVNTVDGWVDEFSSISRNITPAGVTSRYRADQISPRDVTEEVAMTEHKIVAAAGRGETVTDARNYLAELKRDELKRHYGVEVADQSNAIMLDYVKYFMFPNFHPWWGYAFPGTYRFLPHGTNPEESLFEVRWFAPALADDMPASAEPIEIGFDNKCSDVGNLGFLGHVIDQDVFNMEALQKGVRAARPDRAAPILSTYQERQLTQFYERYDELLGKAG